MAIEVHVQGRVAAGKMPYFADAVKRYNEYAATHDYAVAQVLQGLSGPMNTVRLVYRYADLSEYEEHEAKTLKDVEYARLAGQMSFVEGTLRYEIYRQA